MARYGRNRFEELRRLFDRHIQDVGDGLALEVHLERLTVVARAVADLTRHIDIRKEVHLNLDRAVAGAVVAPTTLDVERETSGQVAANLSLGRLCEQFAHVVEDPGVCCGVAARGPPDRPLVDMYDLVQVLQALDGLVPTRHLPSAVELVGKNHVEDVVDQRRLSGTRNPCDRNEVVQRKTDIHVVEVVFASPDHRDHPPVLRAPDRRDSDLLATRKIRTGDGVGMLQQVRDRA